MMQRERPHDESNPQPFPPHSGTGGSQLNDLRQQAAALHAAADAAIANALSGNSQKFNDSMRQEGGQ
jgi:hypothetical protein